MKDQMVTTIEDSPRPRTRRLRQHAMVTEGPGAIDAATVLSPGHNRER